jgi:hypothetical protein
MHATVERVRPALGQEGILLIWQDEGLGLEARDFDLERLGQVISVDENPNLPGCADVWYSGEILAHKGMKVHLKPRPRS